MGKYMKKLKMTCDVAVMEVVGVRTRAKTLALQKLQSGEDTSSSSYLQLRSRRLQKIIPTQNPNPRKIPNLSPVGSNSRVESRFEREIVGENEDWSVEPSFGENNLEFDDRERSTRESTPCSFIREPTPGSTTRQTSSAAENRRSQGTNPTTQEIEEFFASAEKQQHRLFAEKYNYDVVNDVPLPGRYEWVRVEN